MFTKLIILLFATTKVIAQDCVFTLNQTNDSIILTPSLEEGNNTIQLKNCGRCDNVTITNNSKYCRYDIYMPSYPAEFEGNNYTRLNVGIERVTRTCLDIIQNSTHNRMYMYTQTCYSNGSTYTCEFNIKPPTELPLPARVAMVSIVIFIEFIIFIFFYECCLRLFNFCKDKQD